MKLDRKTSAWVIGMALFSMFFGSGNLIFPLYIGTLAKEAWIPAAAGFLISAVMLPFLGALTMVLYRGDYRNFFSTIGSKTGFLLSAVLLTVWIPLGSAPRCMTLAFASVYSYFGMAPPVWVFCLVYSFLVYLVIKRGLGVLDILGKVITPMLLCCIAFIFAKGSISMPYAQAPDHHNSYFLLGLVEGYNTMDLIASFFFSASVIHLLTQSKEGSITKALPLVFKGSAIGMTVLGIVYIALISLSAHFAPILQNVPKDQLLAYLAQQILGPTWSIVALGAILLACFSTSIALVIAYTDFLHEDVLQLKFRPVVAMLAALSIAFVMSLFGLEGITYVTGPVLKVGYPILIMLIIFNLGKMLINWRFGQEAVATKEIS